MARGLTARQIRYYSEKVVRDTAKELAKANITVKPVGKQFLEGEGFGIYPRVLRASNGETAILIGVNGERKEEISRVLRLWY